MSPLIYGNGIHGGRTDGRTDGGNFFCNANLGGGGGGGGDALSFVRRTSIISPKATK